MKSFRNLFRHIFQKKIPQRTTSWVFAKMRSAQPVLYKEKKETNLTWCPFAFHSKVLARTRGAYRKLYPEGAVIHFTAGHPQQRLSDAINYQKESGMLYFIISSDGSIAQNFPLTHWGYHAGKSSWSSLQGSVSKYLVGIELCCPGKLSKGGIPYFNSKPYPSKLVRRSEARDNIEAGTYYKFTKAQEESLIKLLKWLKSNRSDVFDYDLVLGHDEVSPGRKNDPGGSLSLSMPELRKHLKND